MKRIKKWIATIIISVFLSSLFLPFGVLAEEFENKEELKVENTAPQEETEKILIEENEIEEEVQKDVETDSAPQKDAKEELEEKVEDRSDQIIENLPVLKEEKTVDLNGDEIIEFKDENLKNVLLSNGFDETYTKIDKNADGLISKKEIESLSHLSAKNKNIISLQGLEYAINLTFLDLCWNFDLRDIMPIKDLEKLTYLNLEGTSVPLKEKFNLAKIEGDGEVFSFYEGHNFKVELSPRSILSKSELENIETTIAPENLVKTSVRNDYYYGSPNIILEGISPGNGVVTLAVGDIKKEVMIEVKKRPEGLVVFEDAKLEREIVANGRDENYKSIDKNKDGLIDQDEIQRLVSLSAYEKGITSVSGLEKAINLKYLNLSRNSDLENIDPIKELAKKMDYLYLKDTKVSAKDRIEIAQVKDMEIISGVVKEPELSPKSILDKERIHFEFKESIAEEINNEIKGITSGKTEVLLNYEGLTKTFNLTVNDVIVEQPIEEPVVNQKGRVYEDGSYLNGNGDLWNISSDPSVLEKRDIKSFQLWDGGLIGIKDKFRFGITIDENNDLWMKDHSSQGKTYTKLLENIKGETVSEHVYVGRNEGKSKSICWNFAIDEADNLWKFDALSEKKEYEKVLENVKKTNRIYALTKDNELYQVIENNEKIFDEVVDFNYDNWSGGADLYGDVVFALKADGTLWEKEVDSETKLIASEVETLMGGGISRSDSRASFVKKDKTYWVYNQSKKEFIQESTDAKKQVRDFVSKNDGSTYYLSTDGEIKIFDGEIKELAINRKLIENAYLETYYISDTEGRLWKWENNSENKAILISSNFLKFLGFRDWKGTYSDTKYYLDTREDWFTLDGEKISEEEIIISAYGYDLKGNKIVYYRNENIPLLNEVKHIEYTNNNCYATRTDGSLWLLSESVPPQKVQSYEKPIRKISLTGRLVDEDGKPLGKRVVELHSDVQITETDSNGYFTFEKAPIGAHTLYIKDKETSTILYEMPITIAEGDKTEIKENGEISVNKEASGITLNLKAPKTGTEMKIEQVEEGNKTPERISGDIDNNQKIEAYDALLALQIATGKRTGTPEEIIAGNVDGEDGVQAYDALRILQFATGKIIEF